MYTDMENQEETAVCIYPHVYKEQPGGNSYLYIPSCI